MTQAPQTKSITGAGQRLYEEAKAMIPGGTQLFGKRQEMAAPQQWPTYYAKAQGCQITDLDGKTYIDMCPCGIGATVLGYADPDVTAAVIEAVQNGVMTNLNPPQEVELAKLMLEIHPWAKMVRIGRLGGETMAMAVRIARARTRRDKIAFCGYHGWHDWYLAANLPHDGTDGIDDRLGQGHLLPGLEPRGVPKALAGTSLPFTYNRIDELKRIVDREGTDLAAIVMEPTRTYAPEPGFLEGVRELADGCGAKLIFDEISVGWKLCLGGAHMKFGITPDIAVFSKSTGNGHPISVAIGTADTMQATQDTFISSALWSEAVGPAAAVAAITKMKRIDVPAHIDRIGRRTREGLDKIATAHHLPLRISGHPAMTAWTFDHPQSAALQTLWTVRMLERGFLALGGFFPMLTHQDEHVDAFIEATDPVYAELAEAIEKNDVESRIGGPVKHSGFQRLA
jgi:glutamate-1-semialdehyde 2,1-aminomutase